MEFRRLDPAHDLDRLREFLGAADPNDYLLEDLSEWIHEGRLWAGESGGEWVAFGRLHDLGDGEGWVSGMRVLPERRGEGLGGRLLDALLADARSIGVRALRAAIEEENLRSRRLFERSRFRPVATLTLRRGLARRDATNRLRRARSDEGPDGPVGWLPALTDRVDLLPGSDGGRFGAWRPSLLARWAEEGKLYLGSGLAVAIQVDWWRRPRTLWVNPLRGDPASLIPALGALTGSLEHEEWQAFLPTTDELRGEYAARGLLPHPAWGDRVQLYERMDPPAERS
jgi:RimJ/RimL family protein N-acetyltransferase